MEQWPVRLAILGTILAAGLRAADDFRSISYEGKKLRVLIYLAYNCLDKIPRKVVTFCTYDSACTRKLSHSS